MLPNLVTPIGDNQGKRPRLKMDRIGTLNENFNATYFDDFYRKV